MSLRKKSHVQVKLQTTWNVETTIQSPIKLIVSTYTNLRWFLDYIGLYNHNTVIINHILIEFSSESQQYFFYLDIKKKESNLKKQQIDIIN